MLREAKTEGNILNDLEQDNLLLREAFEQVVAVYENPNLRHQLESWRKQSQAHERAALQAEADWAALGQVDDVSFSILEKMKLFVQIQQAKFTEKSFSFTPVYAIAIMLVIMVYLGTGVIWQTSPQTNIPPVIAKTKPTVTPKTYTTGWRQQRSILLSDGSNVLLDWNTKITVSITTDKREIILEKGKALFDVASDPKRPFSVNSDSAKATAIGTQFVVHRLREKSVEVQVLEGTVGVQVSGRTAKQKLNSADVIRINKDTLGQVTSRPLAEIGAWRDGVLVFEQRPLREVLEVIQPYTSYQLDTSKLIDIDAPVSGSFLLTKGDDALKAIMQSHRLTGKIQGRNTLVVQSLPPKKPF